MNTVMRTSISSSLNREHILLPHLVFHYKLILNLLTTTFEENQLFMLGQR